MKPHGQDFGRWTRWARPENPPKPLDFVIAGVSSGTYTINHFEENLPHYLEEKRLMSYHFYEHAPSWKTQVDIFAKNSELAGSKALWWDYERSKYSVLSERTANETAEGLYWLGERFPRVGLYSNIYTYVRYFQKYVGDLAKTVEWWVAGGPLTSTPNPDWEPYWKYLYGTPDRPFSSCRFYQYSWIADAQVYGAINDKKSMDLDVYQHGDMAHLDAWLGVGEPEPPIDPPPPPDDSKDAEQDFRLDIIDAQIAVLSEQLADVEGLAHAHQADPPPEPPAEPPADPPPPPNDYHNTYNYAYKGTNKANFYRGKFNEDSGRTKLLLTNKRVAWNNTVKLLGFPQKIGGDWFIRLNQAGIDEGAQANIELALHLEDVKSFEQYEDVRYVEFEGARGFIFASVAQPYKNGNGDNL